MITINRRIYNGRKRGNGVFLTLATMATVFGLFWLAAILYSLFYNGFAGISLKVFTEITPPPGQDGGLANAIVGSLAMSFVAVVVGTPIGVLAGTHLAEYGRYSWLSGVVRFINDILLSAPSILIGLFVYVVLVLPKHGIWRYLVPIDGFSAWAGAAALMVIVIPVVVRTTENMLLLVPNGLREAATALGAPRSRLIRAVTWRAARAGMLTGVLLAIARISGETAPLLLTALNNNYWSSNLIWGGGMREPIANLPYVIFTFAMSPYEDWHRLAWAGALIITAMVLTLSVIARLLESSNKS